MGAVRDALGDIVRFVPSFLLFLVILAVGWLCAVLLRTAVHKLLGRIGFHRLAERGGVGRALARARFDASDLLAKLVYYAILLFTLQVAFGVWGPNPVSDLIDAVVGWLPRAVVALIIVVVAAAIAAGVRDLAEGALGGLSYGRPIAALGYWLIVGLGVVAALNQIGIATAVTTPVLIAVLATIGGILVVGVGGGLVRPMQQRWEGWLSRVEQEAPEVSARVRAAAETRRAEAERLRAEAEARAAEEARLAAQEQARRAAAEEEARRAAEQVVPPTPGPIPGVVDAPTVIVPQVQPPSPGPAAPAPPAPRPAADDTVVINPPDGEQHQ
ncbi:mechanosensitive ion channel family protein [Dactylosporangium sp. CA-092794]|uniref:mechanosensitive ion channel family protein n=1 Tax=Dactylosporangium sp. CA-092794 TaxID=3239929 RepID=UPI003D913C68